MNKADFLQFARLDDLQCHLLAKKPKLSIFMLEIKLVLQKKKNKTKPKTGKKTQRSWCWVCLGGVEGEGSWFFEDKVESFDTWDLWQNPSYIQHVTTGTIWSHTIPLQLHIWIFPHLHVRQFSLRATQISPYYRKICFLESSAMKKGIWITKPFNIPPNNLYTD